MKTVTSLNSTSSSRDAEKEETCAEKDQSSLKVRNDRDRDADKEISGSGAEAGYEKQ